MLFPMHSKGAEMLNDKMFNNTTYHVWNDINSRDRNASWTIQKWWNYKLSAYQHAADNYQQYDWHIAFDMDEIPFSPIDIAPGFLKRILKRYASKHPHVSEFIFQGPHFIGTPSQQGNFFSRYLRRANKLGNVKPIYQPSCIQAAFHHNRLTCGKSFNFPIGVIRMNHYWGGRLQDFGPMTQQLIDTSVEDKSILPLLVASETNPHFE